MIRNYKRAFCFLDKKYDNSFLNWDFIDLPFGKKIYFTQDLDVKMYTYDKIWTCCIGTFMDTESFSMDIESIAEKIVYKLNISQDKFYDYIEVLNGRWAIFYGINSDIYLVNDATGMRSVWYNENKAVISSHYKIVQHFTDEKICNIYNEFCDFRAKRIKNDKQPPWCLPGDLSPYQNIKMLMSNHVLYINDMTYKRFWPRHEITNITIDEAADYIASTIKREADTLVSNYDVIQGITAGNDSRISLAAVKDIKDKIQFFTYHDINSTEFRGYESTDRHQNFYLAKNIAKKENLKFVELHDNEPLNENDFRIINDQHYHHSIIGVLQSIKNNFADDVMHIRSNLIEIIRHSYFEYPDQQKDSMAAHMTRWSMYFGEDETIVKHITDYYEQFIKMQEYDDLCGINPGDIFYMEYRMNQWLCGAVLIENDICFDTFMLFNTRKILQYGLHLSKQQKDRNVLVFEVIKKLWPELLSGYRSPNIFEDNFSLVDWNIVSSRGIRRFDKNMYNEYKYEIKSGNLYTKDRVVNIQSEPRYEGITFGFSDNILLNGDYIDLVLFHNVDNGKKYYYEFDMFCFYCYYDTGNTSYQILINDNIIYKLPINTFTGKINQIIYCFRSNVSTENRITIRINCNSRLQRYFNGLVNVRNIILRQEFQYKENFLYSTHDNLNKFIINAAND